MGRNYRATFYYCFIAIASVATIFTLSCASMPKGQISAGDTVLTQTEAKNRFAQVTQVNYKLEFNLVAKSEEFSGTSIIDFNFTPNGEDLRVDFFQGNIHDVRVNQQPIPTVYNGRYLTIDQTFLTSGKNEIQINFKRKFNTDGRGFVRFVDPEDQKVYTYTHLEPYRANWVFPCFDQPDLKATYEMKVTAPLNWEVVTSVRETSKNKINSEQTLWNFPQSQKFSTYIWSLHAGDYKVFQQNAGKIPMRLFVRSSLAKNVKTKDWFKFTKQGLNYFPTYFGYQYPYIKYDSIIAPAYNSGAMENVAAVTFSENFVKRGTKTRADRRRLASVILHEMAHMWFGDLVTMKWWNDLWLNESFATYMAALAMGEATEFKEAWRGFNGTKQWAYWEDQLVTTHPIEADTPDTAAAMSNFDGITYGKGASSMKQLAYYIGPKKFQKGLQIYFKRHAEGNTELKDFMAALSEAYGQSLEGWQQKWLQTANLNSVGVRYECVDGLVDKMTVYQQAPKDYPTIRPHRFKIAFLNESQGHYKVQKTIPITLDTETQLVSEAKGQSCNGMVDPNYEDYGYFKSILDPKTITLLYSDILKVKNDFQRQMFWTALWEMVRVGELNVYTYTDILLANVANEVDDINLRNILQTLNGRSGRATLYYMPKDTVPQQRLASEYSSKLESLIWSQINKSFRNKDRQKTWFDAFVDIANTKDSFTKLEGLLTGNIKVRGLIVDQDRRWDIVYQLSRYGHNKAKQIIEDEIKRDGSDKGQNSAISAKAALPDWDSKKMWISELNKKDSTYSSPELKRVMWSLFPDNQDELRNKYSKNFYKDLKSVIELKDSYFAANYTAMTPEVCQDVQDAPISDFISSSDLHPVVSKRLKVNRQEAQRCHHIRTTALKQTRGVAQEKE